MSMVMSDGGVFAPINATVERAQPDNDAELRNIARNYYSGLVSGALIPSRDGSLADFFPQESRALAAQYELGDAPPAPVGYASIHADVNDRVSDRVAQLASLPINGGPGLTPTKTTMSFGDGGFGNIPAAGPGLPALPSGTPNIWSTLGQQLLNAGVNAAGNWLTSKIGGVGSGGGPPALPGQGGTGGQSPIGGTTIGGGGGINMPNSPGRTAGVIMTSHGPRLRVMRDGPTQRDYRVRINSQTGQWELMPRHMNPLNPHAAARAYRRLASLSHFAKRTLQHFGYHVSGHMKPKGKKGRRR